MLQVADLTVHREGRLVLDGLSFVVPEGAALGVLGPNGSGKTTLLEAIAGLLPQTSGSVVLDGRRLNGLPAHRRAHAGLRLVGEGRRVVPQVSVQENLDLARLGAGGRPLPDAITELFPRLRSRWRTAAGQLSGGEQQMLALAMGLVAEPKVLLLDEPSFGLAPQVVDELFATLARLRSEAGLALLLAEQHAKRALELCDRVLVIRSGRTVLDSAASETRGDFDSLVEGYLGRQEDATAVPTRAEVTDLVQVRLPVSLKRRLQLEARERGVDPNELFTEAVTREVQARRRST
ncbi:MAG TPA: ABC transporter ATP-binding protein [Candidatus Dormibacteraeota bacterium]